MDEPFEVDGVEILYPAEAGGRSSDIPQSMIWNCRCTILAWVKGFEGETVKSSPKLGDLTFEEWQQGKKSGFTGAAENGKISTDTFQEKSRRKPGPDVRALVSDTVATPAFAEKIAALGESERITRAITQQARTTLWRRNGTPYEDLIYIDPDTGKVLVQRGQDTPGQVGPTAKMVKMLQEKPGGIIVLHNHPHGMLPSLSDLESAKAYKYGIIVGHNGTVMKYSVASDANCGYANVYLDFVQEALDTGKDLSPYLVELARLGIDMEVMT
ncbi:MAG: hypothetical protein IK116_08930 [Firmicutes bacterium]|nr:hypothetical protein [Bacillota bacterium]